MTNETAASTAAAVPAQRAGDAEPPSEPTSTRPQPAAPAGPTGQVPFERLLAVATLSPGQASLVAVRLLRAAASGAAGDEQTLRRRLPPFAFKGSGELDLPDAPDEDGTSVVELLQRLLENARRLPAHPRPEQHLLLRHLEEAATEPGPGLEDRADRLEEAVAATLGPGARRRLAAQLAALVEAAAQVATRVPGLDDGRPAGSTGRRGPTSGLVPAAPQPSHPAPRRAMTVPTGPGRAVHRRGHLASRARRRRVALVVLVVLAALAASAYVGLLDRGASIVSSLGGLGGSHSATTHAPPRPAHHPAQHSRANRPRGVPVLGPLHAGPVAGVVLHKTGRCRPGALCPVKVTVHLRTGSAGRPVRWKVGTARLCKRVMAWSPATTVTPRPGWRTIYASSSVRVPRGRALALLALTSAPARAQSPALPVAGTARHC